MKPIINLWYCKANKKSGKPIIVQNIITKDTKNTNKFRLKLYDKKGRPVLIKVEFDNSYGRAKVSGATTMLQIWK